MIRNKSCLKQNKTKHPDFEVNGGEIIGELKESAVCLGQTLHLLISLLYICYSLFTLSVVMNGTS